MKVYDPYPAHPGSPVLIHIRTVGKECPCGCGIVLASLIETYGYDDLQYHARQCVKFGFSNQQGHLWTPR